MHPLLISSIMLNAADAVLGHGCVDFSRYIDQISICMSRYFTKWGFLPQKIYIFSIDLNNTTIVLMLVQN